MWERRETSIESMAAEDVKDFSKKSQGQNPGACVETGPARRRWAWLEKNCGKHFCLLVWPRPVLKGQSSHPYRHLHSPSPGRTLPVCEVVPRASAQAELQPFSLAETFAKEPEKKRSLVIVMNTWVQSCSRLWAEHFTTVILFDPQSHSMRDVLGEFLVKKRADTFQGLSW